MTFREWYERKVRETSTKGYDLEESFVTMPMMLECWQTAFNEGMKRERANSTEERPIVQRPEVEL